MLPYQTDVSSKYGAPMGRNIRGAQLTGRVYLRRVPLNGDYDQGGAYWGMGRPLFCAWNDEGDALYLRADNRTGAKIILQQAHNVTFYR